MHLGAMFVAVAVGKAILGEKSDALAITAITSGLEDQEEDVRAGGSRQGGREERKGERR